VGVNCGSVSRVGRVLNRGRRVGPPLLDCSVYSFYILLRHCFLEQFARTLVKIRHNNRRRRLTSRNKTRHALHSGELAVIETIPYTVGDDDRCYFRNLLPYEREDQVSWRIFYYTHGRGHRLICTNRDIPTLFNIMYKYVM